MEGIDLDLLLRAKAEGLGELEHAHNLLLGLAAGAVAAGAAIAGGMAAFGEHAVNQVVETGHQLKELSDRFGISVHDMSRWTEAGAQLGVSQESIAAAFQRMSSRMGQLEIAFKATGKLPKNLEMQFKELGVKLVDTHGHFRNMNDVMLDTMDRLGKMTDIQERNRLSMMLLGGGGAKMIEMFKAGKIGIQELMDKADKFGSTMTGSQVDATEKLKDAQYQWNEMMKGLTNTVGMALLPIMTKFMDWMASDGMPIIKRLADDVLPLVMQGFDFFSKIIEGTVFPAVANLFGVIQNGLFPVLQTAITSILPQLQDAWKQIEPDVKVVADAMMNHVLPAIGMLISVIAPVLLPLLKGLIVFGFHALATIISQVVVPAVDFLMKHQEDLKNIMAAVGIVVGLFIIGLQGLATIFTTILAVAVQGVIMIFENLRQAIQNGIDIFSMLGDVGNKLTITMVNIGAQVIGGMIKGISGAWDGLVRHFTDLASKLPDPIKRALGIQSPSSVFADLIGAPIVHGIAKGITSGAGAINSALTDATNPGSLSLAGVGGANVGRSIAGGGASSSSRGNASDALLKEMVDVLNRHTTILSAIAAKDLRPAVSKVVTDHMTQGRL